MLSLLFSYFLFCDLYFFVLGYCSMFFLFCVCGCRVFCVVCGFCELFGAVLPVFGLVGLLFPFC